MPVLGAAAIVAALTSAARADGDVAPDAGAGGAAVAGDAAAAAEDWTAALVARTDDIAKEVAGLRGLKVKQSIKRDVMSVAALRERLVTALDEDTAPERRAAEQLTLKRWGLVAPGVDIQQVLLDVLTEQIAGFYDPKTETLYIPQRDGADSAGDAGWADALMAHEIVHALQDQHFDLERYADVPENEGDAQLARQAVVEGDGMVSMIELMLARQGLSAPWGMPDAVAMLTKSMEGGGGGDDQLSKAPLVVRELLMFPYARGLQFIAALRARGAWTKVDQVFAQPPESTEQILHPELYLAHEHPQQITVGDLPSLAGWVAVDDNVLGEAGWSVLLRQHGVDVTRALDAAAGWGGDRVALYLDGDQTPTTATPRAAVAVALTSWDAEIDAMEFEEAAVQAVEHLAPGVVVEDGKHRTVWLGLDARVSIVERDGARVVVVIGAPPTARDTITAEVAATWKVTAGKAPKSLGKSKGKGKGKAKGKAR
ncbi:MAG: hypothetical protein H6708_30005 [Kofleriaceae bacterium]|nr:hypothetical protein [Kofleriaceae bacterium]